MHPLVALGMAGLFALGTWFSFTFNLWFSVPLFFILWFWIISTSDSIGVIFVAALAVPIMIGLFAGNVYFYATAYDTQTPKEIVASAPQKTEESFSLWKWLNTKPFAEYAEKAPQQ